MPIRFRCLACHKPLSSASSLAGKHIVCPVCKASIAVPQEEPAQESQSWAYTTDSQPDPVPKDSPEPVARPFKNLTWAASVLALLMGLTATLAMALRSPDSSSETGGRQRADSEPSALAEIDLPPASNALPDAGLPDFETPLFGEDESEQESKPSTKENSNPPSALDKGGKAPATALDQGMKPVQGPGEKAAVPVEVPANTTPPVLVKMTASGVRERWAKKRRSKVTDTELRQQLMLPAEVDLESSPGTVKRLISQSPKAIASGVDLIPRLSSTRADLIGLPFHTSGLARMSTEEALNLRVLSGRLRLIIQNSIPGVSEEVVDARPDHELLRRQLLGTPQQTLWLRPQAISTLRQLLMAEHKNVRLVLVDLLSNIDGRLAGLILAERAIFDLDAEVRLAALVALNNRPSAEYESALVAGLRYPWPAMADHAAEALVVLNLKNAVPRLAMLLDSRELGEPYALNVNQAKRAVVPELVRINHLRNCLLCHSYSGSQADPIRGLVPHAEHTVPLPVAGVQIETKGWGGGGGGRPTVNVVTSTFVRPDVTFLRQDFSIVQPVPKHGRLWPADQRFDYLIRLRPINSSELDAWQNKLEASRTSAPQSDALLYALRELTGEDPGATPADWKRLYSTITGRRYDKPLDPTDQISRFKDSLVTSTPRVQAVRLALFRDKTGPAYDSALAQAIPELPTDLQKTARGILADRYFCMPVQALAEKLGDKDEEVRRAGVTVSKQRKLKALTPELIALLDDSNPDIAGQAHHLLQQFSSRDLGPRRGADRDARQSAMTAWRDWWEHETERLTARKGASQ